MAFKIVKNLIKGVAFVYSLAILTSMGITAIGQFTKDTNEQVVTPSEQVVTEYAAEIDDAFTSVDFEDESSVADGVSAVRTASEQLASETNTEFQMVSLSRVVDGDTIVVDIYGDSCGNSEHEYTVRLIGVNTPESVASAEYLERTGKENTEEGAAASDFVKELLSDVEYVYLQQDVSETDRYDRLLRYVWLEIPENEFDLEEIQTEMLNGILVSNGYAEVATYEPDVMHQADFEQLAQEYEDSVER